MKMLTEGISIQSYDGHTFGALVGSPAKAPAPVIVIAQEIFGVNAFMRETVSWLVDQGYAAVCPDLYRSEEHTSELQSLMRISYAVFCLKKKKYQQYHNKDTC